MRMALRDLRHDLSRPAGLELVVYGSWWIGHCQLYSFPMKQKLDAPFQEWAHQIESVSVPAAVNAALAFDDALSRARFESEHQDVGSVREMRVVVAGDRREPGELPPFRSRL